MDKNKRCDCTQGRVLDQSGWGEGHHTLICPACKTKWYDNKDGSLTKTKPFNWPVNRKSHGVIWKAPGA